MNQLYNPINLNIDEWFVVLLWDPDYSDTSPWNVKADNCEDAVRLAKLDWYEWLSDDDDDDDDKDGPAGTDGAEDADNENEAYLNDLMAARPVEPALLSSIRKSLKSGNDRPDVHKIYKSSWIGERVD